MSSSGAKCVEVRERKEYHEVNNIGGLPLNLSVELAPRNKRGLQLKNPLMTASGTVSYGTEYAKLVDIERLGAIISKGTTLSPHPGNPQPRLAETASGLLNSVGLQNIGIDTLIREKAPIWATWRVPVIVNIAGESITEYAELARRLEGVAGVSGIEVNISCPNVALGGLEFGKSPEMAAEVTRAVKSQTTLPVITKLTPNVTDIAQIARAVEKAGADAISLINTLVGMAIDINEEKPFLGGITGGLSGPAIKPIALYMVYQVSHAVGIPIIGCGGIASANDALEFIMAGASAVQIGTAILINPNAPIEVLDGIMRFMEKKVVEDIAQLVGVAKVP
ncbi:MAG: dihydroorotate dehydrogenase [Dehalococcoidia bacterium]|nr:dihydroorotate dehydrogenase [Dehalococcoidia bacterium]